MKTMTISGNNKTFLLVNTTDYNKDSKWTVNATDMVGLKNLGVDLDDDYYFKINDDYLKIDEMKIGDVLILDIGCYLMRVG